MYLGNNSKTIAYKIGNFHTKTAEFSHPLTDSCIIPMLP